ncbi:MAG: hypothetical protein ABI168_12870, partial [Ginsengibacter sp.]
MRTPLGAFIIVAIMLLLDWYVFMALKTVSNGASQKTRGIIFAIYGTISLLAIAGFLIFIFTGPEFLPKKVR